LEDKQKRRAYWISRGVCLGVRQSPNRGYQPGLSQNRGKVYTKLDAQSTQFRPPGAARSRDRKPL